MSCVALAVGRGKILAECELATVKTTQLGRKMPTAVSLISPWFQHTIRHRRNYPISAETTPFSLARGKISRACTKSCPTSVRTKKGGCSACSAVLRNPTNAKQGIRGQCDLVAPWYMSRRHSCHLLRFGDHLRAPRVDKTQTRG